MPEKRFYGVSGSTKEGHSKLRGQPLQGHVSAQWRCMQKEYGEDLVQLNGGSGSSKHLVWGHRAQQDRSEWCINFIILILYFCYICCNELCFLL